MKQVIGILGGMGPRATVQFEAMLLDRFTGSDQQLPTIVCINDGAIPDRSNYILGKGSDPLPRLQRNLVMLERFGADVICIPCNTACCPEIFSRLQPLGSAVMNLPQETLSVLSCRGIREVMLLATDGTLASNVYQTLCAAQGITCYTPDAVTQQQVMRTIRLVKDGDMRNARVIAGQIVDSALIAQSSCIILGCTELPLVQDTLVPPSCLVIDTLAVLADACVRYTSGHDS